ncbi:hypothetical protein HanRHA438_Chr04g0170891 [Helianthus annuus]|nr:hypothetical protein HanRHA438_Chr04g0170891 [Helianthus annuus]
MDKQAATILGVLSCLLFIIFFLFFFFFFFFFFWINMISYLMVVCDLYFLTLSPDLCLYFIFLNFSSTLFLIIILD